MRALLKRFVAWVLELNRTDQKHWDLMLAGLTNKPTTHQNYVGLAYCETCDLECDVCCAVSGQDQVTGRVVLVRDRQNQRSYNRAAVETSGPARYKELAPWN